VSFAQDGRDLDVHQNVLRIWVRDFDADPKHAFPGLGQMKPEQAEIDRLRKEVARLKAERDILKKPRRSSRRKRHESPSSRGTGRSGLWSGCAGRWMYHDPASMRGRTGHLPRGLWRMKRW
jgi:transposase